jgi:hypothetical protein
VVFEWCMALIPLCTTLIPYIYQLSRTVKKKRREKKEEEEVKRVLDKREEKRRKK